MAAAHEGEASFASDCNKEDCDRRDGDRQDAVTEKLKKCGSYERRLLEYLFVSELQCPNIENAASDMAKQDIESGKELLIILLFRRWLDDIKIPLIYPKSEVVSHAIANMRSCGRAHLALLSSTSPTMLRLCSLKWPVAIGRNQKSS